MPTSKIRIPLTSPWWAALMACTPLMLAAPQATAGNDGCRDVHGAFRSVPATPCDSPVGTCTDGELFGKLGGGSYDFVMNTVGPTPEADVPFVQFFTGTSTITLRNGTVLTGVDTGSLNALPPTDTGSGTFATLLTVTEGGQGHLWIRGTLDLASGEAEGSYRGELCVAE